MDSNAGVVGSFQTVVPGGAVAVRYFGLDHGVTFLPNLRLP